MALSLSCMILLIYFTKGLFESFIFLIGILFGMEYMELLMTGKIFNKKSNTKILNNTTEDNPKSI